MSAPDTLIEKMFAHMKTQIENPALANSRFRFDEVLFMDINFCQLNLTRGSFYLPLPDWLMNKRAIINPENEIKEEYFKWAVIAALHHEEIKSHPERISNMVRFEENCEWGGLEFPLTIKGISERNDVSPNVLGVERKKVYP